MHQLTTVFVILDNLCKSFLFAELTQIILYRCIRWFQYFAYSWKKVFNYFLVPYRVRDGTVFLFLEDDEQNTTSTHNFVFKIMSRT